MRLNKYIPNEKCIGKECCASIDLDRDWVCYSDEQRNSDDKLLQVFGYYRDVYAEGGMLAYCDGECCKIIGYDEAAETVTLSNDNDADEGKGRALSIRGDNAYIFTIPLEQFKTDFGSFYTSEHESAPKSIINELICRRCKSSVFKSDNPEYVYQCLICDEDLYSFEVEQRQPPIVEGTIEDTGFKGDGYADEWCSHCENVTYNIPTNRVSLCVHCGEELFPCAGCDIASEGNCGWANYLMRCDRFSHSIESNMRELERRRNASTKRLQTLTETLKAATGTDYGKIRLDIHMLNEALKVFYQQMLEIFVDLCAALPVGTNESVSISRDNKVVTAYKDEEHDYLVDIHLSISGVISDDSDYCGIGIDELANLVTGLLEGDARNVLEVS